MYLSYKLQVISYNRSMKLVVGLGNPGEKYAKTRHNAGFMFVDFLYKNSEVIKPWKFDKYSNAEISEIELHATRYTLHVILAKPQTFMNRSGETVKKLMKNEELRIATQNVFVAHDDLDIKLGEFKVSLGKGPKLHNGISSIEEVWKTKEFWRIRIGVDNRSEPISGETYVLQNFHTDELSFIYNIFPVVKNQILLQK